MGAAARPRAWVVALALGVLLAAVWVSARPPAPVAEDAPAADFSAMRARAVLERLVGNGVPHPTGSEANARVREAIVAELTQLGYAPEVTARFVCGKFRSCATVRNVVARLEGRETGKAVMLASHYDSEDAAPGAADDGAGVAAMLEIARAVRVGPAPRRPVLFLFDEGEEDGLLGAQAFVDHDARARDVGAVVNFEARGTSGASLLFEMRGGSGWLADSYRRARRPRTSSLFAAIYELLPNDTDLTVFAAKGIPGVNFGIIGEPTRYHTPLDDLAHLDVASLQHHGDNGLSMLRALAEADLEAPPASAAVFFDVLGTYVIAWPQRWALPLSGVVALATALGAGLALRKGSVRKGDLGRGALAWVAGVLGAPLAAGALAMCGVAPRLWDAHPAPFLVGSVVLGMASPFVAARALFRAAEDGAPSAEGAQTASSWWGAAMGASALAVAVSVALPGASYLFALPAAAAACVALATRGAIHRWPTTAIAAPVLAAGLAWFPVLLVLYDALGTPAGAAIACGVAFVLAPAAMLAAGLAQPTARIAAAGALGASVAAAVVAAVLPHESPAAPESVLVTWHEDGDTGRARWLVAPESDDRLASAIRSAAPFGPRAENPFPWSTRRAFVADAPAQMQTHLPPPAVTIVDRHLEGHRQRVSLHIASARGARELALYAAPSASIASMSVQGTTVPTRDARARTAEGWLALTVQGSGPEGATVELVLEGDADTRLIVADRTPGLPAGNSPAQARTASEVTVDDADSTFVTRNVILPRTARAQLEELEP
ncbi:M20/M25/M40 family metallo-hydrolase [Pendulispora albinea]|uniref:M20/M25/M40 family metallo-hydrolase n=1 Tax=Pendulispora albinea TaxID=2741071 RepID=A0ABZ2MD22_9BACT